MSSDALITVENLSKCYQIYERPRDRLMQMLARGRRQYFREFWALRDISFEIKRGETVGIVGRNGSGKSTLLQLICGTLSQTSGELKTQGRIAALLELGAGFNPEFTGRENVYLAASLYGLSKQEIESRFDDIAAFADIGDFIDQPVKTYSSGMFVRLAFAVIVHVDADILVIDEALSVGDAYFVQKCMRFLRTFMEKGTLLFCSHDTGAITNLCSKAILLDKGRMVTSGAPKKVIEHYLSALYEDNQGKSKISSASTEVQELEEKEYRDAREDYINHSNLRNDMEVFRFNQSEAGFGAGEARIVSVDLLDEKGKPLSWAVGGEDVILDIRCKALRELSRPIIGFQFKDRLGQAVFADNTFLGYQHQELHVKPEANIVAQFKFRLPVLPSGDYSIGVAIADGAQDNHVQHHWVHDAVMVRVHASSVCFGLVGVPMREIVLKVE